MKQWIRLSATVVVLALAGWYVSAHRADFAVMGRLNPWYLPALIAVPLAMLAVNGWIGNLLVRELGVRLSFAEWYGLSCVSALGNYLPIPQAGSIARGVYLRRVHSLPYTAFAASVLVTYVFFYVIGGLAGFAGLTLRAAQGSRAPWPLWVAFGAMVATVLLFLPQVSRLLPIKKLGQLAEGWRILGHPRVLARVAFWQAALLALNGTGIWLAYASVGHAERITPASWGDSLMLASATQASGILNVTPGNVGVAEGALGLAATPLGLRIAEAVVAYSIFRLMCMATIFTTGPAYWVVLARKSRGAAETAGPAPAAPPLPSSPAVVAPGAR